ncbi:MAG: DNA polymerase (family 10) [Phycisphaerales bacterium]|jgi:DNA polymerase (family 10)
MGFNSDLAANLNEIAEMLELLGENRFRVNAHQKAARVVKDLAKDLAPIANDPKALIAIEGIGKGIAEKITQLASTGKIDEHQQLTARVPPGLLILLRVPGLGPKKVKLLWDELGVQTVEDLTRTLDDGSAANLKGMGAKTVDNIRESLAVLGQGDDRLPIGIARPIAEQLLTRIRAVNGVLKAEYAGSLRRGAETIGDLDILVAVNPNDTGQGGAAERIGETFRTTPGVVKVLAAGPTKSSVRLSLSAFGVNTNRWGTTDEDRTVQADLRVVPEASWGAALLYFTGSKAHNVRLRERAQKIGLTLNEYGLFPEDQEDTPPQTRGVKPLASNTEAEVYARLSVHDLPPTMREDRGELSDHAPTRVIETADIKAELHSHTTASDGKLSILESATIAKARGFHTLAITDHSKSSAIAGGLSAQRLTEHAAAIREANLEIDGLTLLAGSEVDILVDGSLDYNDDVLATLDVVVASPHVGLRAKPAQATKRLLKAIGHPMVHILGHPTGRLINKRPGLEPAMDELIAAAVEHDVALEINAHWMRLDLRDTHVRAAVDAGCKIAIDCDVHHAHDYDNLIYGVLTAQRGWLTPDLCVNTWDADRLHTWLKSKR